MLTNNKYNHIKNPNMSRHIGASTYIGKYKKLSLTICI
jgi:hypothetical protein